MSNTEGETPSNTESTEVLVGLRLRHLRNKRRLSLRVLAEKSGLHINTLSLIENGKSSPSVNTLQQLASALEVPIMSFFETGDFQKTVVYTPASQRPLAAFENMKVEMLGKDLSDGAVLPFIFTLEAQNKSSEKTSVHTGHEFVFCLSGQLDYTINDEIFILNTGDSLLFQAHLPHFWVNSTNSPAKILLVFFPADKHDQPDQRHFN